MDVDTAVGGNGKPLLGRWRLRSDWWISPGVESVGLRWPRPGIPPFGRYHEIDPRRHLDSTPPPLESHKPPLSSNQDLGPSGAMSGRDRPTLAKGAPESFLHRQPGRIGDGGVGILHFPSTTYAAPGGTTDVRRPCLSLPPSFPRISPRLRRSACLVTLAKWSHSFFLLPGFGVLQVASHGLDGVLLTARRAASPKWGG